MKLKFITPFLLFALLLAAFSLKLILDPEENIGLETPLLGKNIPGFSLTTIDGKELNSRDLQGLVLLNFFASWCESCRYEQPALLALAKETGVPLYGVALKDEPEKTAAWLEKFGNPYSKVGADYKGEVAIAFGITGVPETFLLKNGVIILRQVGPIDQDTYIALKKNIRDSK